MNCVEFNFLTNKISDDFIFKVVIFNSCGDIILNECVSKLNYKVFLPCNNTYSLYVFSPCIFYPSFIKTSFYVKKNDITKINLVFKRIFKVGIKLFDKNYDNLFVNDAVLYLIANK